MYKKYMQLKKLNMIHCFTTLKMSLVGFSQTIDQSAVLETNTTTLLYVGMELYGYLSKKSAGTFTAGNGLKIVAAIGADKSEYYHQTKTFYLTQSLCGQIVTMEQKYITNRPQFLTDFTTIIVEAFKNLADEYYANFKPREFRKMNKYIGNGHTVNMHAPVVEFAYSQETEQKAVLVKKTESSIALSSELYDYLTEHNDVQFGTDNSRCSISYDGKVVHMTRAACRGKTFIVEKVFGDYGTENYLKIKAALIEAAKSYKTDAANKTTIFDGKEAY